MTSTEIADKLCGDTDKDTETLTALMLAEKDRETKRLLIGMLDKVNEYAQLCECGVKTGVGYRDFLLGNCPFEAPDAEALEEIGRVLRAAISGDADAQYTAAMLYLDGVAGLPDFDEAVKWLTAAAAQKHPKAMYELGVCCINGEGMPHNSAAAEKWFVASAEAGNLDAMLSLASMYRGAKGLPEDPAAAYGWYKRAAEAGSSYAYLHLGICTFNGSGVEANVEKAIEYVRIAEKMGNSDAKMLLKRMQRYYEEGDLDAAELAARD